ncbi:ABC transporter permease (plasmid) [Rossellomorea sp. AcN35-11]|nr:ABC transporter permease [Rossellomorea aquimaris]WJV32364.1 ABC transporter permease [Rossellomorea sp. AcN35-11]
MNNVLHIIKEQISNRQLILRLAAYELKSSYRMNYLGLFWSFLVPVLQILVFWVVFGMGIRSGSPVGDTPYFAWLVIGLVPWFYISPSILQGANSVYSKVNLVSKMKFPVSILPSIEIAKNTFNFLIMLGILIIILLSYGINSGLYLLQLPYYLIALFTFLYSVSLLLSTLSTIIRDVQLLLQAAMRMLFFLTPIFWDPNNLPEAFKTTLQLNPLYYLVDGFRNTFLGYSWFFEDMTYTLYFWYLTLLLLFVGAALHAKFKDKFVDYL